MADMTMRTRDYAESHRQRMVAALTEAGRPDLAEELFVHERAPDWWAVGIGGLFRLFATDDDTRLMHKAHVIAGGMVYCYECWSTQDFDVMTACDHVEAR